MSNFILPNTLQSVRFQPKIYIYIVENLEFSPFFIAAHCRAAADVWGPSLALFPPNNVILIINIWDSKLELKCGMLNLDGEDYWEVLSMKYFQIIQTSITHS